MPIIEILSPELKVQAVREYLDGGVSQKIICERYGVPRSAFQKWLTKYKTSGSCAFFYPGRYPVYSEDFRRTVAEDYLNNKESLHALAIKYKIPNPETIRRWSLRYNGHEVPRTAPQERISSMTKGRKTTFEERMEIVQYTIAHNHNYKETAEKFQISYHQARSYVKKYEENGPQGLVDNRGRNKTESEMTELEKLRAENKFLRAQNERAQMEISFLKKLEEIERRRG